ncbi:DUF3050 domain-containing protein [Pseudofulvibacter geojedonensis]|uniref:DUF3050 domain-containing protein n=1 Tax=Pseudofulvibacter geojedonensis TaxID=1123758 RepID=A0ABW3I129_9FLAO
MIEQLLEELEPLRKQLVEHELYNTINSKEDLQIFTQAHVFAVWDFMSMLKALQNQLTCVETPWVPSANPTTRRFINEIVLGEESDVDASGKTMSHYEMYLEAMNQLGANTQMVTGFCKDLPLGLEKALDKADCETAVKDFVRFTFKAIATNQSHIVAAVFTFGREDLIPDMFIELVKGMQKNNDLDKLVYYLERHIELDGDEHGPISLQMVKELCGNDELKWQEALAYSKEALQQRIFLWDNIAKQIQEKSSVLC